MFPRRSIPAALFIALALVSAAAHAQATPATTLRITPASPVPTDHVIAHAGVSTTFPLTYARVDRAGNDFTITPAFFPTSPQPPDAFYTNAFDLGPLPAGSYSVHLADASVSFEVVPAATTATVLTISPSHPVPTDHVIVHAGLSTTLPLTDAVVDRTGNAFTITPASFPPILQPPDVFYTNDFDLGPLPVGSYSVTLADAAVSFDVVPQTVLLLGNRFQVTLLRGATVEPPAVVTGGVAANAVAISGDSGYFWFFDQGNVEVTLKILDGTPVNDHFWLFAATMTDQPFVIVVNDTQASCGSASCPPKLYANPAGKTDSFIDVNAFPPAVAQ